MCGSLPLPRCSVTVQFLPASVLCSWQEAEFEARAAGIRSDIERLAAVRAPCSAGCCKPCPLFRGAASAALPALHHPACPAACILKLPAWPSTCRCPDSRPCPCPCPHGPPALTTQSLQSNDALRAEIERLRGEPSPLLAARTAKEETLADKEKFLKLLDNLQVGEHREITRLGSVGLLSSSPGRLLLVVLQDKEQFLELLDNQQVRRGD